MCHFNGLESGLGPTLSHCYGLESCGVVPGKWIWRIAIGTRSKNPYISLGPLPAPLGAKVPAGVDEVRLTPHHAGAPVAIPVSESYEMNSHFILTTVYRVLLPSEQGVT